MKIVFAAIAPHPPLLLPDIGSDEDKAKVKNTIEALEELSKEFKKQNPDCIIISSPHPDWGFNVPLYFIARNFTGEIKTYLTEAPLEPPQFFFEEGKKVYKELDKDKTYALIASGDLSHCLKKESPYGFHPNGPEFDKAILESFKKKDVEGILNLENRFPAAGECGLRSFSFLLGFLEEAKIKWQPDVLSYEGPFGVGYLVANLKIK